MKELLISKLGQDGFCFEPIGVRIMDNEIGKLDTKRCVIFPKTSDALTDLLAKKKVYTDTGEEEVEEIKSYEEECDDVVAKQLYYAESTEIENMKKRIKNMENEDRFDSQ